MHIPQRVMDRVLSKWEDVDGCWISTYSTGSHGYAQIGWHEEDHRIVTLAHRVAWVATHGPIPDGMTVDHTCFTRRCINPVHLRLLTRSENSGIHQGPWIPRNYSPPRTAPDAGRNCGRGHPMSLGSNGLSFCRECKNLSNRRRRLLVHSA